LRHRTADELLEHVGKRQRKPQFIQHSNEYPVGDQFAVDQHAVAIEYHQIEALSIHRLMSLPACWFPVSIAGLSGSWTSMHRLFVCAAVLLATSARAAESPPFTAGQLAALPVSDWITNGGNVYNQRYSPLAEINTDNVGTLKADWQTHLDRSGMGPPYSGEAQPIVCAACHGEEGKGGHGGGPNITQVKALELVANTVITGKNNMPPFAATLTFAQIRDVAAFVAAELGK
jgi:cytochrome c553